MIFVMPHYSFSHRAARVLQPKVSSRMLSELDGIRMAAISGDRAPRTAKKRPITL